VNKESINQRERNNNPLIDAALIDDTFIGAFLLFKNSSIVRVFLLL